MGWVWWDAPIFQKKPWIEILVTKLKCGSSFCNTVTLYQSISVGQILLVGCWDLEISGSKEMRRDGNPGQGPQEPRHPRAQRKRRGSSGSPRRRGLTPSSPVQTRGTSLGAELLSLSPSGTQQWQPYHQPREPFSDKGRCQYHSAVNLKIKESKNERIWSTAAARSGGTSSEERSLNRWYNHRAIGRPRPAKGERKAVEDEQVVRGWERRRALSGLGDEGRDSAEAGWQEMQTCRDRQTDRQRVCNWTDTDPAELLAGSKWALPAGRRPKSFLSLTQPVFMKPHEKGTVLTPTFRCGGSVVKNPPAMAGDVGGIPGSGRSPGEGNGLIQVLLPGKSQGQRSLAGDSPWGPKELTNTFTLRCGNWGTEVCLFLYYLLTY